MMNFTSDHPRHTFEESPCDSRDAICNLCKNKVSLESDAYYCRECRSSFHKDCLTITYPKRHEHTLTFIRREISVFCDICGRDDDGTSMYGCLQCDFFVHRNCIYLPNVIKITRHLHRLYHIPRFSDGDNICGICHELVDVRYGGYSCIEKTCNYFLHSFCMIRFNVWDGKDVEGEPEEEVDSEVDLAAMVEIDGRSIRHFSHYHDLMRLDVDEEDVNGHVCKACILPIEFGNFFGCKQCEFSLHDTCASLPRKMENVLHLHPLTINLDTKNIEDGFFTCYVCNQKSCGFMYKCCKEDCGFKIDIKCASFAEPFSHSAHKHSFYMAPYCDGFIYKCYGCSQPSRFAANCFTCWFPLDFKCVNLPALLKYKYDIHPLTLHCARDYSKRFVEAFEWWCEICEEKINTNNLFYTCHDCCTTLHIDCILGRFPYLKDGHKIKVSGFEVEIASSNAVSRPICHTCYSICPDKQNFKGRDDICLCSIKCIHSTK